MLKYCPRVTVDDKDQDELHILNTLRAIKQGELEDDLVLMNFYNDVPVSFKPTLMDIGEGQVRMTVHKLQATVMAMEVETLIRSQHLPHPAMARVRRIDRDSRQAKLIELGYANVPSDRRQHVRVKLGADYAASFKSGKHQVNGTVRDISLGGVAVLTDYEGDLNLGALGSLHMDLGDVKVDVPCKFLRAGKQDEQHKLIFLLDQGTRHEHDISRLIAHRQSEIIRKLISIS